MWLELFPICSRRMRCYLVQKTDARSSCRPGLRHAAEETPEPEETVGTPTLGRRREPGDVSVAPGSVRRPGEERGLDLGTRRGCVAKVGFLSTDGSTGFRDAKHPAERSALRHFCLPSSPERTMSSEINPSLAHAIDALKREVV